MKGREPFAMSSPCNMSLGELTSAVQVVSGPGSRSAAPARPVLWVLRMTGFSATLGMETFSPWNDCEHLDDTPVRAALWLPGPWAAEP